MSLAYRLLGAAPATLLLCSDLYGSSTVTSRRWTDASSGATPLYAACEHDHIECARLLLDAHYSASKARADGVTPLYGAAQRGSIKLASLLLDAGADAKQKVKGVSPVEIAVENNFEKLAALLRQRVAKEESGTDEKGASSAAGGRASGAASSAVAQPKNKREAPGSLAAISEEPEEGEEAEEEEEEEEVVNEEVRHWLRRLEVARTPVDVGEAIRELMPHKQHSGVDDALKEARKRLKRLRLTALDPLYELVSDLPADLDLVGERRTFTAHTIIIVDCSGSMRKTDVATPTDEAPIARSEAVRRALLDVYLKRQLLAGAQLKERVSLIKIQPESFENALPFALFPLDLSLVPRIEAALDEPRGPGPFLPALRRLNELVEQSERHLVERARTQVLFLSDGRPSDQVDERELPGMIEAQLTRLGELTSGSLEQFQLLGFGEADEGTLKRMAAAVPGRVATYEVISGREGYTSLEQSVSTFSSNSTVSRISSVSAVSHSKPLRRVNRSFTERMDEYKECVIDLPPKRLGDFNGSLQPLRGLHDVMISRALLGHGGERNASAKDQSTQPCLPLLALAFCCVAPSRPSS